MTLSALIKKGGLGKPVTATSATLATQEAEQPGTVAPVATVAVAVSPEPWTELSDDEDATIREWLAHIEESDPNIITEVLDQCRTDAEARRYFLQRAKESQKILPIHERICCEDCASFNRIDHPHLGHCAKGEPEAIAGLWDTDKRNCEQYSPSLDPPSDDKPDRNER